MTQIYMSAVNDIAELARFYDEPPDGVRANMIFSLDGAASFDGRAGPLSDSLDQQLLLALRGFTDVVLVGAGTVRAENYGPVRLSGAQRSFRWDRWRLHDSPPIAVVSQSGKLPPSMFADPARPPIVVTSSTAASDLAAISTARQMGSLWAAGRHRASALIRAVTLWRR